MSSILVVALAVLPRATATAGHHGTNDQRGLRSEGFSQLVSWMRAFYYPYEYRVHTMSSNTYYEYHCYEYEYYVVVFLDPPETLVYSATVVENALHPERH